MKKLIVFSFLFLTCYGCKRSFVEEHKSPKWAEGIIWYQIFPERFRNGDTGNDPNKERARGEQDWQISSWTADWYARDDWESEEDFYQTVFQRRYGGDLQGVIDKLDYLEDLGVGGIYFNPVFDAQSLHKYDASYYHHIDRNFGPAPAADVVQFQNEDPGDPSSWKWTSADSLFLRLIEEAHDRGMKVIIDGVWNHTGTEFWAFKDLVENQEKSAYKNWYIVTAYDDPSTPDTNEFDYEGWWGFKGLPVFREENNNLVQPVREHIFEVTKRWMDPDGDGDPSDGVDGWRLDVAEEVGQSFWKEWHELVYSINPKAITVAEIWTDKAKEFLNEEMFTSVMNYRFAYAAKDFLIDGSITTGEFIDRLKQIEEDYPQSSKHVLQNLMDSHDTPRLSSIIVNPGLEYDRQGYPRDGFDVRKPTAEEIKIQKLVALFQFTWHGAPMIYYGTESGMWGADDPDDRKPMLWNDMKYEDEVSHPLGERRPADENTFNAELYKYYSALASIRNNSSALLYGDTEILFSNDSQRVIAFKRSQNGEEIHVLLNASNSVQNVEVKLSGIDTLKDALTGEQITITNDILQIKLGPKSGRILK